MMVINGIARAALVVAMLGGPAQVSAQASVDPQSGPSPAAPAAPPAKDQSGQIQEIVVTAQFHAQNLQTTPLSITAVNSALLEARNQTNIAEVAQRAPSVELTTGGQGGGAQTATVAIRGIGQADFNFAIEPGVGTYIDDVYYGVPYGTAFDLVDLDRVEILRGPQGTLSGKNSIGGSFKLYSRKASAADDAYLEATGGSYHRLQIRGATNFTLVDDKLFLRLTGMAKHVDGYFKRYDYSCVTGRPQPGGEFASGTGNCKIGDEGGQEVYAARAALRWIVSDHIENNLVGDFTEDRSGASPTKLLQQGTYPDGNNYLTGLHSYSSYGNYTGHPDTGDQFSVPAISHLRNWGVANTLDINLPYSLSVKSITAYRAMSGVNTWDGDGSPESVFLNYDVLSHRQFTEELRLSGRVGKLADFTVGGFYYRAHDKQGGRIDDEFAGLDFAYNDPITATSKSGFAQVVVHPTSRINITGGLRYTSESKHYLYTRYSAIPGDPPNPILVPLNGLVRDFSGNRWDYRIAVDYEIAHDIRPYAQISTGFKGGGVNPRPFFVQQAVSFNQEKVKSYEAGIKTFLFDRHVRLNGAYYHTSYNNFQAQVMQCDSISPFPGAPCSAPQNVGNAKIDGFEVESEVNPFKGLSFDGSMSYTNFRFTSVLPTSGLNTNTRPQFSPKWKYAIGGQYRFDVGEHGSLTPRIDWTWQSSIESSAINNEPGHTLGHVDAYGLLNAHLTYRSPSEAWQLSLDMNNALNKYYYVNKYEVADRETVLGQPGRPREVMVTLKRKF